MKSRIFLIGEGDRDIGRFPESERKVPCDFEGDLPRLLRRLWRHFGQSGLWGYEAFTVREIVKKNLAGKQPSRIGSNGKAKDLRDAVITCVRGGSGTSLPAAVIALIDARANEVKVLQAAIREILAESEETGRNVPVAIGLAIQEVEIWMLADPGARAAAFGDRGGRYPLEADLEAAGDPKSLWSMIEGEGARDEAYSSDLRRDGRRLAAWEAMDPSVVAVHCPVGFGLFFEGYRRRLPPRGVNLIRAPQCAP